MVKDKDGKIGGVRRTGTSQGIEKTEGVSEVSKTQKAKGVGKVKGSTASGSDRSTRVMTMAERQALFNMIEEEADKLFGKSGLSSEQKQVVQEAVKMAVDAAIVDDEDSSESSQEKDS